LEGLSKKRNTFFCVTKADSDKNNMLYLKEIVNRTNKEGKLKKKKELI